MDFPKPKKAELAPAFFFLASSLNIELVYIILKGITKFSYLNCSEFACEQAQSKMKSIELETDQQDQDFTIVLRKIKIKDSRKWS